MPAARGYCNAFRIKYKSSDTMTELNQYLVCWKGQNLPEEWTLSQAMSLSDWLWRNNKTVDTSSIVELEKEIVNQIEEEIAEYKLDGKTREAVIQQRVNQGIFRNRLILRGKHCKLCQIDNEQFLVASHIKPWRDCQPEEKLDSDNGFLMCPNHDKAFDRGFISFDDGGKIMISSHLSQIDRRLLGISEDMQIPISKVNKKYLNYHRKNIFLL